MDNRIILDAAILAGKPVLRGTRQSVEFVITLMADGWSEADILAEYPRADTRRYYRLPGIGRDILRSETVFPSAA